MYYIYVCIFWSDKETVQYMEECILLIEIILMWHNIEIVFWLNFLFMVPTLYIRNMHYILYIVYNAHHTSEEHTSNKTDYRLQVYISSNPLLPP